MQLYSFSAAAESAEGIPANLKNTRLQAKEAVSHRFHSEVSVVEVTSTSAAEQTFHAAFNGEWQF